MAAEVETMYSRGEKPWHGLGVVVRESPTSEEALKLAGPHWRVIQEPIFTGAREEISGFKANVRNTDRRVLGVVTDRYKVVQNARAFSFTGELLGHGVRVESAGSLFGGRKPHFLQDFLENTYPRRKNQSLSCLFQYA